MVRPKASRRNLDIGIAFAELISSQSSKKEVDNLDKPAIYCTGSMSIFDALASLAPSQCREMLDKTPSNRQALAAIELNKALKRMGWKAKRKQESVDGERFRPTVRF
jgi:hypothetical protein